jgi:hypothetical protein
MKHGPVDVIVMAAGEPRIDGSVLTDLEQLTQAGTIRVIDAMLLVKNEDGVGSGVDIDDLPAGEASALGFIETGTRGLFDTEDADTLFEGMVPGSAVLVLAIEHLWAVSLVDAIEGEGMEMAMNWRIPAPVVDEAFAILGA